MTRYPKLSEVLVAHERLIERFGGSHGVRDRGQMEAALARPQSGYYADVIEQAAALWESFSQNHPFIDGNKRIAVAAALGFLRMNGIVIQFDDLEAYRFLIGLYESGNMRFRGLDAWIRAHTKGARP